MNQVPGDGLDLHGVSNTAADLRPERDERRVSAKTTRVVPPSLIESNVERTTRSAAHFGEFHDQHEPQLARAAPKTFRTFADERPAIVDCDDRRHKYMRVQASLVR